MHPFLISEAAQSKRLPNHEDILDYRRQRSQATSTRLRGASEAAERARVDHIHSFWVAKQVLGHLPPCTAQHTALLHTSFRHQKARRVLSIITRCAPSLEPHFSALRLQFQISSKDSHGRLPITEVSYMKRHERILRRSVKYPRVGSERHLLSPSSSMCLPNTFEVLLAHMVQVIVEAIRHLEGKDLSHSCSPR
jgi:hypothetical protein